MSKGRRKKKRIKAPPTPKQTTKIPQPESPKPVNVTFSFQFLDSTTRPDKFPLEHQNLKLSTLLDRLRSISQMEFNQFIGARSSSLRAHPINWADTSEPNGFSHIPEELQIKEGYQFSDGSRLGRVHGFILGEVFYIVWLDPTHALYS